MASSIDMLIHQKLKRSRDTGTSSKSKARKPIEPSLEPPKACEEYKKPNKKLKRSRASTRSKTHKQVESSLEPLKACEESKSPMKRPCDTSTLSQSKSPNPVESSLEAPKACEESKSPNKELKLLKRPCDTSILSQSKSLKPSEDSAISKRHREISIIPSKIRKTVQSFIDSSTLAGLKRILLDSFYEFDQVFIAHEKESEIKSDVYTILCEEHRPCMSKVIKSHGIGIFEFLDMPKHENIKASLDYDFAAPEVWIHCLRHIMHHAEHDNHLWADVINAYEGVVVHAKMWVGICGLH